jgi:hypothetical protein
MRAYNKVKDLDKQLDDKIKNYMVDEKFDSELIKLAELALEYIEDNGKNNTTHH